MQDYSQRFQSWITSLTKAGKISSCGPLAKGGRTMVGPKAVMSDGPYAESKDMVGGYTVLTAEDLNEASEISRGCLFLDVDSVVVGPACPACPFFQEVIFHRKLANLALQLGDLALIFGDAYLIEFVCKLSALVLLDPLADETA